MILHSAFCILHSMARSLRLLYLLEDTSLSGGTRVVLAQADALIARGHQVTLATRGAPLHWRHSSADWIYAGDLTEIDAGTFDLVIGTFWTTLFPAWKLAGPRAVHLCQGYEGLFTAYQDVRDEIDAAYRLPIPKLVVSPSLVEVIARFGAPVALAGQIVDEEFYRSATPEPNDPPRVLLAGAAQIDFKGIDVGYGAVTHARHFGATFRLVRVSPWAPAGEEPARELADEFHVGLDAPAMRALVHGCDLFLGPSRKEEGFGLPAAEAMASGLPAALTRIPSFSSFDSRQDYALFADEDDAAGLGDALIRLLEDEALRRTLSERGREVAEQFRPEKTAARLESFFLRRLQEIG
ncbi:MAG TPA: glycosyltransferase family 4 protein [Thermoanaerobaculia bacterium]|nr:glycosyltransferase family 4 protein [Thermoanaerobaculia bacterium]